MRLGRISYGRYLSETRPGKERDEAAKNNHHNMSVSMGSMVRDVKEKYPWNHEVVTGPRASFSTRWNGCFSSARMSLFAMGFRPPTPSSPFNKSLIMMETRKHENGLPHGNGSHKDLCFREAFIVLCLISRNTQKDIAPPKYSSSSKGMSDIHIGDHYEQEIVCREFEL